ncbi:sensor histidine kinase [Lunatibacter salilacus]|uniref:sensor histidine kinase n=1 Tax=Lunatibacter salilacus TaxID=2483804 RepID=UPI00131DF0DF|nr:histidine kinase [Lunatibacter salilacus]
MKTMSNDLKSKQFNKWFWIGSLGILTSGMSFLISYYGQEWLLAIQDGFVYATLLLISTQVLLTVYPYFRPSFTGYKAALVFPAILTVSVVFVGRILLIWLFKEDSAYRQFLDQSLPLRMAFVLLFLYGISVLILFRNEVELAWQRKEHDSMTDKMTKEAELFYLRQQLQPHFLFNSLNSINALVGKRPEEARDMIQSLADFFRLTIQKDTGISESFSKEWERIVLYLKMEKVRFGDRLEVNMDMEEGADALLLPPLLLQPLVENAIKFGLYGVLEKVVIRVNASRNSNYLQVAISNPYDPSNGFPKGTGFGLESVRRRLYLLFGRNDLVKHQAHGDWFEVTLKIPQLS